MKTAEKIIEVSSRNDVFKIYVLGDTHFGHPHCAENAIRSLVNKIHSDPNAYWFGGGDMCDAIIFGDKKRFEPDVLPDWMLSGTSATIRNNLKDIAKAERNRFVKTIYPIRDKCLGLIEGNHEYSIMKYHNRDYMSEFCDELEVENLTDCAFCRLIFRRGTSSRSASIFIAHGYGSGRTVSSEIRRLHTLSTDKDCDIILVGHSHTFAIHPPIPVMVLPRSGNLMKDPKTTHKHAANWGSYVYNYKDGPASYATRALYPAKPMYTVEVSIMPHKSDYQKIIHMTELNLI
jgi:hypothetical protein